MQEMIKIETNERNEQLVSARELHKVLESAERFSKWFDRMLNFGFIEGEDFASVQKSTVVNNGAEKEIGDYILKIDMAKHIAMVQRSEIGSKVRQYFIDCERKLKENTPQLSLQEMTLLVIEGQKKEIEKLKNKITEDKPRVEFAKVVEGTSEKILIGDFAKLTDGKIGRNRLFSLLREKKILMSNNMPYQQYLDRGYFEVTERVVRSVKGDIISFTTYISGSGQVWLLNKLKEFDVM